MAHEINRIYRAHDPEFKPYGRLIPIGINESKPLIDAAGMLAMPASGAKYEASMEIFEHLEIAERFRDDFFGELPVEIGCCWGHNRQIGALEWHASSEINVAATDFILKLGKLCEMENGKYDASKIQSFLIEKGQSVEIYATTLHFCPCTDSPGGFRCVIVLPKDTNLPLERMSDDPLLFRKNKWIVCHIKNEMLMARGIRPGLFGNCYTNEQ